MITVPVAGDPNSDAALNAVRDLRNRYLPGAMAGTELQAYVTGASAQNLDYFDITDTYLPIVFALVLGLSFILLTLAFRSIVVPASSIAMNLLSVGAAYGLLVLVTQEGHGAGLFGFQVVPTVEAWIPLFLFSVLFGLSMDYQVFLLSRIRERYDQRGDTREAVAYGITSTARLITGAALIMVAVFAGFAAGELVMFQQMGFGLGVAILIDATLVRTVLMPAGWKCSATATGTCPGSSTGCPTSASSRRQRRHPGPGDPASPVIGNEHSHRHRSASRRPGDTARPRHGGSQRDSLDDARMAIQEGVEAISGNTTWSVGGATERNDHAVDNEGGRAGRLWRR